MAQAFISTGQNDFRRIAVASVPATYAAAGAVLTTTKPSSGVLIDWQANVDTNRNASLLRLMPWTSTTTATGVGMRLLGWSIFRETIGANTWWIPTVLGDFTLTYTSGTVPQYSIDTQSTATFSGIVQVAGTPPANAYSPASVLASNVEPAAVLLDTVGCELVTVQFKSSGTPTMGVFYTTL
jgi:hypothetical protein